MYGQQDIHQKIMQLNFRDCHAKIRQVLGKSANMCTKLLSIAAAKARSETCKCARHDTSLDIDNIDICFKIMQVDSHATSSGVVVQVSGELSNNGQPMRRFMQTFVLAPQSPKKYYVHNDIFR